MNSPASKYALKNALSWAFSANAIANIINLSGIIIFGRLLGVEVIGQYGVILVAIELLFLFLNFGFNQAAIKYGGDQAVFSASLTLIVIQSFILLIIASTVFVLVYFFKSESIYLVVPAVIILSAKILDLYVTLSYAPLESQMQYKIIALSRLTSIGLSVLFWILIAVFYSKSIYVLVLRDVTSAILMLYIIIPKCPLKFKLGTKKLDIRKVWKFSLPIWHLNMLERGALRGDYALAAIALGQSEFGIYFQVRALVEGAIGFVVSPIQTVIYSFYCRHNNKLQLFRKVINNVTLPLISVSLMFFLIFFFTETGQYIINLLLGSAWEAGGVLLAGFTLYACGVLLFEHSKVVGIATDKKLYSIIARLMQLIVIAIAVVPMIEKFGMAGAAYASAAGVIVLVIVATFPLYRLGRNE